MTPLRLYILLLFLTACSSQTDEKKVNPIFGQRVSFTKPELTVACTRAIKTLDNEIHGVSFISNTGHTVSIDTINSLLYEISKYDIPNDDRYDKYLRGCNSLDFLTWMSKTHKNSMTRIEKIYLKTNVSINGGGKNLISITDFDIYSVDKPNHVAVRIINEYDLQYLKFGDAEYFRVAESIPVGLDVAITKLDSLKKNACR